jgi:hypothetical protein
LWARWRPRVEFNRERGHHVLDDDATKIREALGTFLPPAFIADALGEAVAWWPLKTALRDMPGARDLQRRLAERLGAATEPDVEMTPPPRMHGSGYIVPSSRKLPADDPAAFVSVSGKCQNVGMYGRWVTITTLDAERTYAVEEIEAALTPAPPEPTETTRRKGART